MNSSLNKQGRTQAARDARTSIDGFTLVELLVVIGIIVVLIGILVPAMSRLRVVSQESATRSSISTIEAACQAYHLDFRAYPGPMSAIYLSRELQQGEGEQILLGEPANSNTPINNGNAATFQAGGVEGPRLTGTENLLLGLMGGLNVRRGAVIATEFLPANVGLGAVRFSTNKPGRAKAYLTAMPVSRGKFTDESILLDNSGAEKRDVAAHSNPTKDTVIPEFVDSFASPMPLLYLRARKGGLREPSAPLSRENNDIITEAIPGIVGQYNLIEIAPYTQSSIGVGKRIDDGDYKGRPLDRMHPHGLDRVEVTRVMDANDASNYQYPYNAYAYLRDPATGKVRNPDSFILISAGRDRVYGTADDITNFGSVLP